MMSDKEDYLKLIAEVEKINPEAAEYMRTDARNINGFKENGDLDSCFVFDVTRQGFDYWEDVCIKIGLWSN